MTEFDLEQSPSFEKKETYRNGGGGVCIIQYAIKHSITPLRSAELVLLPIYTGRRTSRINIDQVPRKINER